MNASLRPHSEALSYKGDTISGWAAGLRGETVMIARSKRGIATALRICLLTATFVGPMGAFAMANAGAENNISGAGLVLYVSLQRAG
jgi:hypothetical protein